GKLRFIPDLIRTIALIVMKRIDLVYFQRSDHRRPRETGFVFRLCRWFGIRTVFDVDDEIDWTTSHCARVLLEGADAVIVASHALLEDAKLRNSSVYLLHTPFDETIYAHLQKSPRKGVVNCGFVGDGFAYLGGLREVLRSLDSLDAAHKRSIHFTYLGSNADRIRSMLADTLRGVDCSIIGAFDWSNEARLAEVLTDWDIGLVPRRTGAKGGSFKAIQYLALGVVPIACSEGENLFIIGHGVNGFVVNKPDEWSSFVEELMDNPSRQIKLAAQGRSDAQQYSLGNYCASLDAILQGIICGPLASARLERVLDRRAD
ncbi:MAG: glycosyltransferase, partial [Candidatus Eisenbacteria sp.]|nr:glycosyltransferase [Candidatus Eisenbacteria bacterium]